MASHLEPWLFFGLLALMAAMLLAVGPVLTSDGPAHVSIAHFLRHAGDPAWPQLNRLYEVNPVPAPNAFGHLALAGLMFVLPPLQAEMALQAACLLGVPWAARLALRQVAPGAAWLSLFFFALALQRLFYLGLYNFSLSVVGFLLCVWAWLRLRARPGAGRALVLAGLLVLTLVCQASGWIEILVVILAMLTVEALAVELLAGPEGPAAGRRHMQRLAVAAVLAILPSAGLFLWFAMGTIGASPLDYGMDLSDRLLEMVRAAPFDTVGSITAGTGLAATLTLLAVFLLGLARGWQGAAGGRLAWELCAVPVALVMVVAMVPDRAGGGWTHVWRAQSFPYAGLALAAAALPCAAWLRLSAMAVAAGSGAAAILMAAWLQGTQVPPVVAHFTQADALVGPHCTVVPVLGHYKLDAGNTSRLIHHPTFHLAQRIQWRADRPVLFSYTARLSVYPAWFRRGHDPQYLLFGWEPEQGDTLVRALDIPRWEAATGIRVDHVLLWDVLPDAAPGPHHGLRQTELSGFALVHHSADGRMELYRRAGSGSGAGGACASGD